jgi:hypothetical protein
MPDMDIKRTIKSQYHASLEMLRQAILKCPDALWVSTTFKNQSWRIVFHALFYTHLYLQPSEEDFVPWSRHRDESQFLGLTPWPPHNQPKIGKPYTKQELLEYLDLCHTEVDDQVDKVVLENPSGFGWQPFDKAELQLYNIRHLQQHIGELCERLGNQGVEIDWIGTVSSRT